MQLFKKVFIKVCHMSHMNDEKTETRKRIIRAAAEIFGEKGFKAATIREICRKADANIALVNYYFRDKQGLYLSVLEDILSTAFKKYPPDMGFSSDSGPEEKLRAFIHSYLSRLFGESGIMEGSGKLIARELAEPGPALDVIVMKYISPMKDILVSIMTDLLGTDPQPPDIQYCCMSTVGQCLHYALARPVMLRLDWHMESGSNFIAHITDHIFHFSMGGIEKIKNKTGK